MADAEPQDEPAAGGVGDQARPLRAGIGMPQVDVRDPRADMDVRRGAAHELRGGQSVVVHLGGEDRPETRILRRPGYITDVAGAPACAGDDGYSQSLDAHPVPLSLRAHDIVLFMNPSPGLPLPDLRRSSVRTHVQGR